MILKVFGWNGGVYSNRFAHSARPIVLENFSRFSLIGLKNTANLIQQRSKIDQNMVQHGAKSGSGRLVRHKSGQEAILDRYADH